MMADARILVVGESDSGAGSVESTLKDLEFAECIAEASGEKGVEKAARMRPDLALIELGLEGAVSGVEAATKIRDQLGIPVIYLVGEDTEELLQAAHATHPSGYVVEPFSARQLLLTIETALCMRGRDEHHLQTEKQLDPAGVDTAGRYELMQAVFNSVSDGVVVTNREGEFLYANSAAKQIVGVGVTDAPPDQWSETYGTFYPDKKTVFPSSELPLARAMRGEDLNDVEVYIRNPETPQGVFISVNARQLNGDSETGEVDGGVIVFRDITTLKETEDKLKETIRELQEQTFLMQTVFDSISDGVVVADESGNFMLFNDSAERIVGIGQTESGPDQWTERYGIFFNDRETPFPTDELPLVQAIRGESVDEMEMFIRNENVPEGVHISVSGRPLHDDSGLAKGGVIAFRDVTERIRAEEALTEAFAHGRLEIIDTVLHNIGNAINSVSIGLGTVRNGLERSRLSNRLGALANALEEHRDDLAEYLRTDPQGQKAVPFLAALAKDLTAQEARFGKAIARVEGRVAYIADIVRTQKSLDSVSTVRKDVDIGKAIDASLAMMQESLTKRAVKVLVDCKDAPATIRVQESNFNQMMLNLIKNGVEAIDELAASGEPVKRPRIRIRVYVRDDFLVLDVSDNGIGIEEKNFKIVFSAGYSTKVSGSGLGLHSIANFVLGSGGRIYPLSDGIGKGTTMRVEFRLSAVQANTPD